LRKSNILFYIVIILYYLNLFKYTIPSSDSMGYVVNALVLLIYLTIIVFGKNVNYKWSHKSQEIYYLVFSFLVLSGLSLYHEVSINSNMVYFRRMIMPFLLFPILQNITRISKNTYFKILFITIGIETITAFYQLSQNIHYFSKTPGTFLFSGTFPSNNYLGNYLSIIGIILLLEIFSSIGKKNKTFYFALIIVIVSIYYTGVRTSIISFVIGIAMIILFYDKDHSRFKKIIKILPLVAIITLILIAKSNDSMNRITTGIGNLFNSSDNTHSSRTTLELTSNLLAKLEYDNILLGAGQLWKSGYYVVRSGNTFLPIKSDYMNITDATIALIFVEYGVLGSLIFFLPVVYIWRRSGIKKYKVVILLCVMLSQSITDLGIFSMANLGIALLYLKTE
jgi:hypothetical protein